MARSTVSTGFAKCFIFFMVVVILVQGALYLGLSVWGLTMRRCSDQGADIQEKPFQFAMDIIYFKNEDCGAPSITVNQMGNELAEELSIDWETSYNITNREFIFMIVYAAISGLWVLTSLLVLVTICGPVTKIVSAVCFWPWFLSVIAGSILDAVATGYHVHDILHTTSVHETFEYVGIAPLESQVMQVLKNFDPYFVTPALVMTIISCRVVFIWLLNIFGVSFCLSLSHILVKINTAKNHQKTIDARAAADAAAEARNIEQAAAVSAALEEQAIQQQLQQQQSINQQMQEMEQYPQQIRPKPLGVQVLPTVQRQDSNRRSAYQSPEVAMYPKLPSAPSPDPNYMNSPAVDSTYRNTETHPDRLNYPTQQTPSISPEILAISPLNNRYAMQENHQQQQQQQPQRVSAELRSQLPWSYTSAMGKPQPPPKPSPKVYPDIPEADYATPAKKNERTNNEGVEPQQSYSRW